MTFGIVTPCWKQEDLLRLAAASVREQAGRDVAVDHVAQIKGEESAAVEAVRAACPGLRVFCGEDQGMYDAINRGLDRVEGEVMGYLNADEQYLPGALARVGDFLERHPEVDVVFGDALLMDERWRPRVYRRVVVPDPLYTRVWHLNTLTCATFWRRRVWEAGFRFDPGWKMIGDSAWVVRVREAGLRCAVLKEPLAVFVYTGQNLGSSPAFEEERARWREGVRGWRWRRPWLQVDYMLKKVWAGAYRKRMVEFGPYTPSSWPQREPARRWVLDWRWPREWQHWRG